MSKMLNLNLPVSTYKDKPVIIIPKTAKTRQMSLGSYRCNLIINQLSSIQLWLLNPDNKGKNKLLHTSYWNDIIYTYDQLEVIVGYVEELEKFVKLYKDFETKEKAGNRNDFERYFSNFTNTELSKPSTLEDTKKMQHKDISILSFKEYLTNAVFRLKINEKKISKKALKSYQFKDTDDIEFYMIDPTIFPDGNVLQDSDISDYFKKLTYKEIKDNPKLIEDDIILTF